MGRIWKKITHQNFGSWEPDGWVTDDLVDSGKPNLYTRNGQTTCSKPPNP